MQGFVCKHVHHYMYYLLLCTWPFLAVKFINASLVVGVLYLHQYVVGGGGGVNIWSCCTNSYLG